MKKLLFLSLLIGNVTFAGTPRIQSLRIDKSKVRAIYLAPGMGSILLFPCALIEVFVGRSEDLKAQISPNDKKTMFLNLKLNTSLPTNLIARCEGFRNVLVFDVLPSRTKHQDVVEIRSSYGRPTQMDQLSEIKQTEPKLVISKPKLIEKGKSK